MSPEEFDNRLKSSFQDEFVPPNDQLWQNLNKHLDQSAKKPFWYWLVPVLIVVTAGIAWLGSGLSTQHNDTIAIETSSVTDTTIATAETTPTSIADMEETESNAPANGQESSQDEQTTVESVNNTKPTKDKASNPQTPANDADVKKPSDSRNPNRSGTKPSNIGNELDRNMIGENPARIPSRPQMDINTPMEESFRLALASFPHFPARRYALDKGNLIAFEKTNKPATSNTPNSPKNKNNKNTADFNSKWWLNIGMGPQLSLNSMSIKNDSQEYIHKYLWEKKSNLTHNGSGFQAHALISYKFNKHFMFETGLNYSLRTEDIRMNESTFDIAARDKGKIVNYSNIILKVIIRYPNGDSAITYYNAVSNFSIAVNNKYHIFTVPFKFKSEHKLSENTFLSAGLGGGVSMIYSKKSSHLDMVRETQVTQKRTSQFSGSLNASVSLYTNFNDIGQIGVYTGFQMYTQPWKINHGQYAVRMSDLQLGIMFRKPLDWGKK